MYTTNARQSGRLLDGPWTEMWHSCCSRKVENLTLSVAYRLSRRKLKCGLAISAYWFMYQNVSSQHFIYDQKFIKMILFHNISIFIFPDSELT